MNRPSAPLSLGQTLVNIVRRYLGIAPAPVPAAVPVPVRQPEYRSSRLR